MYTVINFKTKKELKEAVASGQKVSIYQPGPFSVDTSTFTGTAYLEGPHYPIPHTWYAQAEVVDGIIVKVK